VAKRIERTPHHGFDEAVAAAEVMQDRRMGNADVGRQLLQLDSGRPELAQPAFGRVEDHHLGFFGGAPDALRLFVWHPQLLNFEITSSAKRLSESFFSSSEFGSAP